LISGNDYENEKKTTFCTEHKRFHNMFMVFLNLCTYSNKVCWRSSDAKRVQVVGMEVDLEGGEVGCNGEHLGAKRPCLKVVVD
jgi:hypothetical protein